METAMLLSSRSPILAGTLLLAFFALAAPLVAQAETTGYVPPPPPEQALLAPLAGPVAAPLTVTAASLGIAGGAVLSVWSLVDLSGKASLGFAHPSVQNDMVGMLAGMALAGAFAALIDVVLELNAGQTAGGTSQAAP